MQLMRQQEVMATIGRSAGDFHGHNYHHHHTNNHTAAPTPNTTLSTFGTTEAERGAAASALAAARSPGKARLWNVRRYTDSTNSQGSVAGGEGNHNGLTAGTIRRPIGRQRIQSNGY